MPKIGFETALEDIISTINENQNDYESYINEVAEKAGQDYEEWEDQFRFLISRINQQRDDIVTYQKEIREKDTVIDNHTARVFAKYFALNHMLYIAIEQMKEGKTDFLENFNKYEEILSNHEKFREEHGYAELGEEEIESPYQKGVDEFQDIINSYADKIMKTDQYLLMVEDQGSITENLIELNDVLSLEYIMTHAEDHTEIESTNQEEVARIANAKRENREKIRKTYAEEETRRIEEERRQEEEKIRKENEEIALYDKEEASGLYKADVEDPRQNLVIMENHLNGRMLVRRNALVRKHPELKKLFNDRLSYASFAKRAAVALFEGRTPEKDQIEAFYHYIASSMMILKALKEKENGNIEVYNKIVNTDFTDLLNNTTVLIKKSNIIKDLIENKSLVQNLNNFRKLLVDEGFTELTKRLTDDIEFKTLFEGNSAIKNTVNEILDRKLQALELGEEDSERYEFILKLAKAEIELLKNEPLLTATGKPSPKAIHQISKIVACTQIIANDQKQKEFFDVLKTLAEDKQEIAIERLASKLENSKFINSVLQTGDATQNIKNLIELIGSTEKLAVKLNELNYSKALFSGKETISKNELEALEKKLNDDVFDRDRLEEEKTLALGQMKDGFYDVGRESYLYTKNEMVKLANSLSSFADPDNAIFSERNKLDVNDKLQKPLHESLSSLLTGLQNVSEILLRNGQSLDDFTRSNKDGFFRDDKDLQELTEKLDLMLANCDKILEYAVSDTDDFQKLYSKIVNARNKVDEITSGSLFVPSEDYAAENGKKANFVKAENPELKKLLNDFTNKHDYTDASISWVGSGEPLFSHDPSAKDIIQGNVGDCFFVSVLASLASKNPQAIRDMMTLNNDNTVTVRFYNYNDEPVYVTVENTLPVITFKDEEGNTKTENAFSFGARWVQIMEKAFNVSGIPEPDEEHEVISGGKTVFALKSLLGPKVPGSNVGEIMESRQITLSETAEQIFPKEYKQEDLELFYKLKGLHESGKALAGGVIDDYVREEHEIDSRALPGNHAYGITGFSEEGGVKYIHVKNPHSYVGRGYDENHEPIEIPNASGESKLELRDFINNFDVLSYAELNSTPMNRYNEELVAHQCDIYADVIREMDYYLQESSKIKANDEKIPEQLMDLRKKSMLASDAIKNYHIKPSELNSILTDYFESAQKYVDYRDQNPRTAEEEKSPYSAICYTSANVITNLSKIYLNNLMEGMDKAEYVDPDVLKDEVMQLGENDNFVKRCAVEKVTEIKKEMQAEKQKEMAESAAKAKEKVASNGKGEMTIIQ